MTPEQVAKEKARLHDRVVNRTPEEREKRREASKRRYRAIAADPEWRERRKERERMLRRNNIASSLLKYAKRRAQLYGLPFDLEISDVDVPSVCPVLGLPLEVGGGSFNDNSPSIDKIVPELGYVKGNVAVISMLANRIKSSCSDASVFRKIADYIEGRAGTRPQPGPTPSGPDR